jgi:hypothetical protein
MRENFRLPVAKTLTHVLCECFRHPKYFDDQTHVRASQARRVIAEAGVQRWRYADPDGVGKLSGYRRSTFAVLH